MGRAAERLNLTPSAVSHGLGRLRRLLNDPLFLKTPKGVMPTARARNWPLPSPRCWRVRAASSHRRAVRPGHVDAPFHAGRSRWCLRRVPAAAALRAAALRARRRHRLAATASRRRGNRARPRLALGLGGAGRARDGRRDHPLRRHPGALREATLYEEDFVLAMRAGIRSRATRASRATVTPSIWWCRSRAIPTALSTRCWPEKARAPRGADRAELHVRPRGGRGDRSDLRHAEAFRRLSCGPLQRGGRRCSDPPK